MDWMDDTMDMKGGGAVFEEADEEADGCQVASMLDKKKNDAAAILCRPCAHLRAAVDHPAGLARGPRTGCGGQRGPPAPAGGVLARSGRPWRAPRYRAPAGGGHRPRKGRRWSPRRRRRRRSSGFLLIEYIVVPFTFLQERRRAVLLPAVLPLSRRGGSTRRGGCTRPRPRGAPRAGGAIHGGGAHALLAASAAARRQFCRSRRFHADLYATVPRAAGRRASLPWPP